MVQCLRFSAKCCCVTTLNGAALAWTDTVRYLGVYITAAHRFCCSLHNAKRSFYRAFNCIFVKIGRTAGENVIIELLRIKCLPCMYCGLEACPVSKSQIKSLHFAVNSAFRKIFLIKSYDAADECMSFFNCSVSEAIHSRKIKLQLSDIIMFKTFAKSISEELVSCLLLMLLYFEML